MEVNTTSTTDPIQMYENLNRYMMNPYVFVIILFALIAYLLFFSDLGNSETYGTDSNYNAIGFVIAFILVALFAVNALQYFFSISVTALITDLFTNKPKLDIIVDQTINGPSSPVPEIRYKKQVFNIPGNSYDYTNARALCSAYGARLANYKEIEDSYEDGSEWCNYGWSEGQMALFPTQQKTFDKLQTIKGHEHDCGRPGINGGYMANPSMKFGVNCYGNKPKINSEEEELMQNVSPYPLTAEDIAFQQRVDYWKNQVEEILVSPFNYKYWSA
jgi:hypothetical protein